MNEPQFSRREAGLLVALVMVAFLPAWPGGFLVEDWPFLGRYRDWSVQQTVTFELGRPLKDRAWVERERPDFFTAGLWRPLPYILAHLEQRAFDDWTAGWLSTRLLCHAGTAWLFACAVLTWTGRRSVAWLAGAIHGLHPSRFYPVLVMCQSQMLLAAFGTVLSFWGVGVWRNGRQQAGMAAVVVGAAVACWSYEQAVALIVLWPLLDAALPAGDGIRPTLRTVAQRASPLAVVIALYLVLRVIRFEGFGGYTNVVDGAQPFDPTNILGMLGSAAVATAATFLSLAAPISLADWDLSASAAGSTPLVPLASNVALAGVTLVLVRRRMRGHGRATAWGLAALVAFTGWTVLPIAGLLHGHDPFNRYVYFPGFAWVVLLAWALRPEPGGGRRAWRPAAIALGLCLGLAWWGCSVWRAAWTQAHGLRAALDRDVPRDRLAYVYLDNFPEWVGGRNLFIRNLDGPIDVGRNIERLRVWPADWEPPSAVPIAPHAVWPFAQPPQVRFGAWDRRTASLAWRPTPAYEPGSAGDRRVWDLRRVSNRAAWNVGPYLTPVRGSEPGLALRVDSAFALLEGPALDELSWTPAAFGVDLTIHGSPTATDWLEVTFYTASQTTAAPSHQLRARVAADGQPHRYIVSLLDHPVPALEGPVTSIALRPSRQVGAVVVLRELWVAAAAAGPPAD